MSQSFDINTSFDALDNTVYDIFDVDAYCSSLSPSVPSTESVPNTPTPPPCLKRYPKACGHPRPSPAVVSPPSSPQHPLSPRPPLPPSPPLLGLIRERVVSAQPLPHPPPVLWTPPRPPSPPPQPPNSPQNSTSALCGCLSVSTSGSHRDGNQGSTNRVYGIWLKSSTPQKP